MYIRSINKTVSREQTKVIQEVVILEESKLSHSVINTNKESKYSFSTQIRRANIVFSTQIRRANIVFSHK